MAEAAEAVGGILLGLAAGPRAWPEVEAALRVAMDGTQLYLGGDGLRPYVTWTEADAANVLGVWREDLPLPPLIGEVLGGQYGRPTTSRHAALYSACVGCSGRLSDRLDVARVLLVGLGDADRYRGARLQLGVARLAQWLRFTHAAEVSVVDYTLDADPAGTVEHLLGTGSFDILGVSVNFGQWSMLERLAATIHRHQVPLVVLGNILAAFSPAHAADLFQLSPDRCVLVATGLGERPLERLCRVRRSPAEWDLIDGLVRPGTHGRQVPRTTTKVTPPDLVFPDDSLILRVAGRGGQIALETSFGCQYAACTFCPRDHRGSGWSRGLVPSVLAVLERMAGTGAVVSLVDEEFFGSEGLIDPPATNLPAATILETCRRLGIRYEIYTRLEQLFDRRRSDAWNLERADLLARESGCMRRLFVGVESGSPDQLRRYGKGQTLAQTVDALRVASMLGVPLEFGFITFDPLLTPAQLAENVEFMARRDVIAAPGACLDLVAGYLAGRDLPPSGTPVYQHVAYMATELELLAPSRYAVHLRRRHPELLDGSYDLAFARYGSRYQDARIGDVAGWCRMWTEGMFAPVYQARMVARASADPLAGRRASEMIARYRACTFTLLAALTRTLLPELDEALGDLVLEQPAPSGHDPLAWLYDLAAATLGSETRVVFDPEVRARRRMR